MKKKKDKLLTLKNFTILSNAQRILKLYHGYNSLAIYGFIQDYKEKYKK